MSRSATHRWILVALPLAVLAVYAQVVDHQFVALDDRSYVYENPNVQQGLTVDGLKWALTRSHSANWHPVTWLSHMLDCELFGLEAGSHLLVNVLLHAVNAMLLFLALRYMTGALWPAALVAALFALHPLRVESVAWVSERKDVLSGMFWMLTIWAYAWYARAGGVARYLLVAVLMALGLASKSMLVTLPCVLLLLDLWPLRRWGETTPGRLVLEKLPWFGLSAAVAVIVALSQSRFGSMDMLGPLSFGLRAANACLAYVAYLGDTVWPAGLACLYPHPASYPGSTGKTLVVPGLAAGAALAGITAAVVVWRRRRPWLAVGWLWYLGALVPVIGLVQVGAQGRADRYTYLPAIGLYIMIAWGLAELIERRPGARTATVAVVGAALIALSAVSRVQVGTWRTTETLFERALAVTKDNYAIRYYAGALLERRPEKAAAVQQYREVLRIKPEMADAHKRLGFIYSGAGRFELARPHLEAAARLLPDDITTRFPLAAALFRLGDHSAARSELEATLRLDPAFAEAHSLLGVVLLREGRVDEARRSLERALELEPGLKQAEQALGRLNE